MKQSLHLGIGQQLRMTPQLQQAIRLLQLSTLDLRQEIQQSLYENPLLEIDEAAEAADQASKEETPQDTAVEIAERSDEHDYSALEGIGKGQFQGADFPEREDAHEETLKDHLIWQLQMAPMSDRDRLIGEVIIDSIDAAGMLMASIEDILHTLIPEYAEDDDIEYEIDLDDVMHVLHRVQRFDPPGVATRDVQECLLVQLDLVQASGAVETAMELVAKNLDLLTKLSLEAIAKKLRRPVEEIDEAYRLIKSLNPKPGLGFSPDNSDYIVPDLSVVKNGNNWTVILNHAATPRIRLNETYVDMVKDTSQQSTKDYLRNHLQEAKWLLRSLESRQDTLLRVGQAIVEHQLDFFEEGETAMKPLILKDLAEKLELHESTISRATSNKYLASPMGVFELKYFFSSQLAREDGSEASSTAIRALISGLVKNENPSKPLSDAKLTDLLKDDGIVVARRTIAKYRDILGIPSSSQRKRLN